MIQAISLSINLPPVSKTTYPIRIGSELLKNPSDWWPKHLADHTVVILTDQTVASLYGKILVKALEAINLSPVLFSFPSGEASKCQATKESLEAQLFNHQCGRETVILALGGGVVGDLAGFLAATYMRGVPYIQIPTTLLAMVDSSVGGKTGIDTPFGKNLIGAFWQPQTVIADIDCLNTLSPMHFTNGLIEAIKMFLTHDKESFEQLESQLDSLENKEPALLIKIITQAVSIKAHVVQMDEKESNQRATLNLGHTIGHALESVSCYQLLHGFAVGLGILVEAKISQLLNILPQKDFERIQSLFSQLGIQGGELNQFSIEKIISCTQLDKKTQKGKVRYVLLKSIGEVWEENAQCVHSVSNEIVKEAYQTIARCSHGR